MNNKEKAEEIGKINARQYHHNTFEGGLKNSEYVFSDEECQQSALDMAEWKDKVFNGFLFELSLKLMTPKTDEEKAIAHAFPMSGLDCVEKIMDMLQNEWFNYQTEGTILKQ